MLRRSASPFQVLLVRRVGRGMFGDLMVFPGGTVDPTDHDHRHAAQRELREETGLVVESVDSMVLVSRWVSPRVATTRFDTLFYMVEVVDPPDVVLDENELVDHAWVTPAEALHLAAEGEWAMILPTLTHLRWLSRRYSIEDAMASASGADGRTLIEPRVLEDGSLVPVYLPAE